MRTTRSTVASHETSKVPSYEKTPILKFKSKKCCKCVRKKVTFKDERTKTTTLTKSTAKHCTCVCALALIRIDTINQIIDHILKTGELPLKIKK